MDHAGSIVPALDESARERAVTVARPASRSVRRPAVATVALLSFVQAWNEYFLPLIFLQNPDKYPITLGIADFRSRFDVQWHLLFAGILIMLIPTVVAFLLASRQFIEGLTQGGVKE